MSEPKKIYCPRCKRKVATYDGRSTMPIVTRCNHCKKRVVYNPLTDQISIKKIPQRNTSSGITFV